MPHSYTQSTQLNLPLSQAKLMAEEALVAAAFRNTRWTTGQTILEAECATTIWSWGETIEVWFTEIDSGTEVFIRSKCRLATQFVDWGKNKKNTNRFMSALKRQIN